jgi:hypothetical protein
MIQKFVFRIKARTEAEGVRHEMLRKIFGLQKKEVKEVAADNCKT